MKIDKYILLIAFCCLIGLLFLSRHCSNLNLKNSHELATATVVSVEGLNKSPGSVFVKYFYYVNGVKFQNREAIPCVRDKKNEVSDVIQGNPLVKVVYEKSNPENCRILLSRENYRFYQIAIPPNVEILLDSLEKICQN